MVKKEMGFTLMEVLVAMLLLVGVAGMVMPAFTSSVKISKPAAGVAYNFGRGLLEQMYEFVRQDWWFTPGYPLDPGAPGTVDPGSGFVPQNSSLTANNKIYTATYTVTPVDKNGDTNEDFRKVDMTVTW